MRIKWTLVTAVAVVAVLSGSAWGRCEKIKWEQPPEIIGELEGFPIFLGWDQYSVWNWDWPQIAAADWRCRSVPPVKDIHFWGSFIDWVEPGIPFEILPDAFTITFWDDVPVGADPRYPDVWWSHPGFPIFEVEVRDYNWEFVGWDVDPCEPGSPGRWNITDATFTFDVDFRPDQCFFQVPGDVYWVSIGAVYNEPTGIDNPWGWKTRPWEDWMIDYGVGGEPSPGTPWPFDWWPLESPCGVSPDFWDLSYVLTMAYVGDANLDGIVDGADYTLWADHYNRPGGWKEGDFNGDGWVDGADYTLWADNYGCGRIDGADVPEPATLGVLALGGLALLRRRRR